MAQQQDGGAVQGVGAVNGQRGTAAADATQEARRGDAARNEQNAQQAPQDGGDVQAPDENVQLSTDAQRAAEEQQQAQLEEQQQQQQAEIDARLKEIEQTKQELQQAEQAGDKDKAALLQDKLHLQEQELGALFDQPGNGLTNAARDTNTGGPQLIPPPSGGPRMSSGGNFQVPQMPYGAGGPTATPAANPNVQIPDFGKNANKAQIGQMLDKASEKYGIPNNILKGVAWQESGWNAKALSFDGHHGKGVMQIDDRFHEFARTPDVFDPAKNIDYGAKYLRSLYDKTGSWQEALKRYNGGSDYPPRIMAHAQSQPWARYEAQA